MVSPLSCSPFLCQVCFQAPPFPVSPSSWRAIASGSQPPVTQPVSSSKCLTLLPSKSAPSTSRPLSNFPANTLSLYPLPCSHPSPLSLAPSSLALPLLWWAFPPPLHRPPRRYREVSCDGIMRNVAHAIGDACLLVIPNVLLSCRYPEPGTTLSYAGKM